MKQSTTCFRLQVLPAILLLCFGGAAQQPEGTPTKQELALEVSNLGAGPWEIPAFDGGGGGAANFRRIKAWKPSSKEEIVKSIDFKIGREADIVIARLSVTLENEKVVEVGTYRLRENESVRAEELTKFGVEGLVLKVVKAKAGFKDPLPPIPPQILNKTKAIEVISFYQHARPSESFQLTLRNVSNKNIIALDLFVPSADGNGGGGQRSQGGNKDHPVMLPGGISVHHIGISRGGRMTPDGYVPDVALQQTLIIRTVVFDDGTYEGLVEPAAEMEAQRRGLDIQRRRILRLLQEPKKTNDGDVPATLNELKEQAYALGKTTDPSIVLELMALFPSLDEKSKGWLLQSVEGGLRDGKLELLRYINDFEEMQKQPGEHITFAEWIKQTKVNYEKLTTTL
jgi:hypothetical protein